MSTDKSGNGDVRIASVGGFLIDVIVDEQHIHEATATKLPVEGGYVKTDHIQVQPVGCQLECIVSDYPIGVIAAKRGENTGGQTWSEQADAHFIRLLEAAEPVEVITEMRTYSDPGLVLTGYTPMRKEGDGQALSFKLTLLRIDQVKVDHVTVKVAAPRLAGKRKLGAQPAKTPADNPGDTANKSASDAAAAAERARKARLSWLGKGIEALGGKSWVTGG